MEKQDLCPDLNQSPKKEFDLVSAELSQCHVRLFATPWTAACEARLYMGILQVMILEWVAIPFSRGFPQPRDWIQVSSIAGQFFTNWATREATLYIHLKYIYVRVCISIYTHT